MNDVYITKKKVKDIFLLLDVVALRYDDRELQIELVQLQIDHEHLTSSFIGLVAIEFGAIIGLASIFYGLYGKPIHFLIPIGLVVSQFIMLIAIPLTWSRYNKKRERLERRIEELRKRYVW